MRWQAAQKLILSSLTTGMVRQMNLYSGECQQVAHLMHQLQTRRISSNQKKRGQSERLTRSTITNAKNDSLAG